MKPGKKNSVSLQTLTSTLSAIQPSRGYKILSAASRSQSFSTATIVPSLSTQTAVSIRYSSWSRVFEWIKVPRKSWFLETVIVSPYFFFSFLNPVLFENLRVLKRDISREFKAPVEEGDK